MSTSPNSYDELPYDGGLRAATSPDLLATVAILHGMRPAPVECCRVLELGCATGGNLIPLALTLTDSQFVGIDLSAQQIALARDRAAEVGLPNLELRVQSILEPDDSLGAFDYIIAHGVYSWVPPAVQDRLLAVCARRLAPQGVAYVSYNTYPGWHLRMPVRDALRAHIAGVKGAGQRVQQAREFLAFLAESALAPESPYARILSEEQALLSGRPDYYLFHEHLEVDNHPVYFSQFMAHAAAHGLQFLHEAMPIATPQAALQEMAPDLIQQEQYLDYLCNRVFRRTLLCHAGLTLNRTPGLAELTRLRVGAQAWPTTGNLDIWSQADVTFRSKDGARASTRAPLVKAALVVLQEAWPRWLPFDDLLAASAARLEWERVDEQGQRQLGEALRQFSVARVIELHAHQPRLVAAVSERPCASPLARVQARSSESVANLHHGLTRLEEVDRLVLPYLDGQHDRLALLARLEEGVASAQGKQAEFAGLRLSDELEQSLHRLARGALLIG